MSVALAGCDKPSGNSSPPAETEALPSEKTRLLFEKPNAAQNITAMFYGTEIDPQLRPPSLIEYIVFKDTKTGQSIKYDPKSDTRQAADFFFADIWSPDGTYLVLPLGKYEGFAIYNAKTAIPDIMAGKPADTIRVWTGQARRFWHNFDGWSGPASFRFKAELEGSSIPYQYNIATRQLSCAGKQCGHDDHAENAKGTLPVQKAAQ